ncbi:Wd repeat-containing protein [Thalictrum thalictroides]|uniref:Wd repeat-containing protein n=1 Tax=Thalictrum thalictroides TaxID=46969 RepID=A0A7J6V2X9_THATH|nr:Wd repeat-containing protein [Thalictrum thalictroides]
MEEDQGIRAHFPLSFGKQTKSQTPIDLIHNATRRTLPSSSPFPIPALSTNKPASPSLSTSSFSKIWLNNFRNPKLQDLNSNLEIPNSTSHVEVDEDSDTVVIGPPRPPNSSVDEDDDGDLVGPHPPPRRLNLVDDEEDDGLEIGPPRPPPPSNSVNSDSDDQSDVEEEEEQHQIPLSNEIVLKGHTKIMEDTSKQITKSSQHCTAERLNIQIVLHTPLHNNHYHTKLLYEHPDRFLCDAQVVSAPAIDHSGSRVLSGSYDYTVWRYDFQGMNSKLASFRQLEPSERHQVRSLSWSPTADQFLCVTDSAQAKIYDRDGLTLGKLTILTSSEDGSLRIWDVTDFNSQKQVIKPKRGRPGRVPVTTCAWDRDEKRIAGGVGDGSIQVWSLKPGWGSRPDIHIEKGHDDDITGVKFSADGWILLLRSSDDSLKCGAMWMAPQAGSGKSLTGCLFEWGTNSSYNIRKHVLATVGDKSQGGTHILYDPSHSKRGALVCVARAPRKKSIDDFEVKPAIHNPHALPLFRDHPSGKRQREKALKDPIKSHKPELPMTGPGFGGRVGSTNGSLLTQYLLKQGGMIKETWMEEDPREVILKYADAAAKDPKFIAPAYAETQAEPVFAKSDSDEEEQ